MSERIVTYLNEQLLSEYDAMFTYMYYAAKDGDPEIRALLDEFWREEAGHARMLMEMIIMLGGQPSIARPEVNVEYSLLTTLVFSSGAEESAVKKYEMLRGMIETPEERAFFDQAIEEERRHHERLNAVIARVRAREKETAANA